MARDLFQEAGISISTGEGRDLFAEAGIQFEPQKKRRRDVPEMTAGSLARDIAAGVLQIGPTAVKGAADIARLATGDRVGTDISKAMARGMESIREVVGSERAAAQRENFIADMADDEVGLGEALMRNKGALVDQILPTVGSMFLPVGVANAVGKLATVGKAAQAMDRAALVARVAAAQKVAGIGTVAAQNAAETFAELLEKGVPMEDAYLGAGITVPFSLVAGVLTGGGAEGAITRALTSGAAAKAGLKQFGKATLQEGAQEMGEEAGQITGEAVATGETPSATSVGKRLAVAGTLGAVMGGGVDVANQMGQFRKPEEPGTNPQQPAATAPAPAAASPAATPATDPPARLAELEILAEQRDLTPAEREEAAKLLATLSQDDALAEAGASPAPAAREVDPIQQELDYIDTRLDVITPANGYGPAFDQEREELAARRRELLEQQRAAQAPTVTQSAPAGDAPVAGAETTRPTQASPTDFWSFAKSKGYKPGDIKVGTPEHAALKAEYDALHQGQTAERPPVEPLNNLPDPALQNRDRSRAASVVQMSDIARNPDYLRLGPSRTPDSGAPMVFAVGDDVSRIPAENFGRQDVAVMSDGQRVPFRYAVVDASQVNPSNFADGRQNPEFASTVPGTIKALNNGRTAGVRAAYELGTAGQYAQDLAADAALHGVPAEVIARTPNPMLVRVYSERDNTADMAAKSQSQALGLSPAELARQDAPLLDTTVLSVYEPGEITSAANRDFVRAFVGKLQAAGLDVAGMMQGNGELSQDGRKRIQAALMQAAYGDVDLVEEMFDSTDTDIKAIGEALKAVAGQWANMRDSARLGAINPQVDVTENMVQAVNLIRKARRERMSLKDLVAQPDLMTGETPDALTVGMLRVFYDGANFTRAVGRDKVVARLEDYIRAAMATSADAGLFGGEPVSPADILATIIGQGALDAQTQPEEGRGEPAGSGDPGGRAGEARPAGEQPDADRGGRASAEDRGAEPGQDAAPEAQQQVSQGDPRAEEGDGAGQGGAAGGQQGSAEGQADRLTLPVKSTFGAEAKKPARKAKGEGVKPKKAARTDAEFERQIQLAADSIRELRKVDVDRVLTQDGIDAAALGDYIKRKRPDLAAEVDEVLAEIAGESAAERAEQGQVALRQVDVFGNGSRIDHYDDSRGLMYSAQKIRDRTKWTVYEVFPESEGGNQVLGEMFKYNSLDEARASVRGLRISAAAKARNAKYAAIPGIWAGEARKVAKALIDAGVGIARATSSSQSKSKYIYTDSGLKIRLSDHALPPAYDAPDFDYRYGGDIDALVRDVRGADGDGGTFEDTATYGPASPEHQQLANTLAGLLSRAYGRAIVLDAVAPGSGAVGGRGRELAAVSTVARRLFGHEVVFVRFKGKPLFNGAMSTAIPDVVFINADATKPMMAVLGHELLHHLKRTNEGIYNILNNRLNRLKKNERDYLHRLEVLYGRQGEKDTANWDEELNADIVGDFFMDPEFWAAMAKDKPGLFRRVANAIIKFLDDVAAKIAGIRHFGTDQYLTDIAAARAAVVDAMRQFSGAQVGAMTSQSEGINLSVAGGQVPEQSGVVRVIYRGTNDSGERISGGIAEGTLFAAADEATAKNYAGTGGKIERIGVKQDAKVLVEGTKEFAQVTGRRRGKLIDTMRKGENLKTAADDAAAKARAAGYDALEFTSLKDLGIAIFNEDKFVRDYSPSQQLNQSPAFDGPEVGNTPEELFQRYPLKIAAERIAGDQVLDQGVIEQSVFGETLYHGTNSEGFEGIQKDGVIKGPVFLTPRKEVADEYGGDPEKTIKVKIPRELLKVDFDLPGQKLLSVEDANVYSGNEGWDISDYLANGYSVGVDASVVINHDAYRARSEQLNQSTLPDTIDVDGVTRPTTNSKGNPIHPTEEGIRNFWRWFGDSKVVDKQGRPLVVYHGTHGDSVFERAKRQVWLTADPNIAHHYAGYNQQAIMPLYAKIENPIKLESAEDVKEALREAGWDEDQIEKAERSLGYDEEYSWKWVQESKRVVEALESLGYDGAKVFDDYVTVDNDSPLYEDHGYGTLDHQSWVVFRPEQIKSAIGNNGQFDPANPSILFQSDLTDELTGLPLNPDGTVTVYHHTSAANAESIRKTGRLKSAAEPDVYVTTRKEPDTGYGDTVVPIRVNPELLQIDDEFPDGRVDYRIDVGRPGGSVKVLVGEYQNALKQASRDTPDTITVDGKQRPTRNSAGQLIHPTEEGIRNFWRWFGSSRVVDEQGRPLVVYHGTAGDISVFRPNSLGLIFTTPDVNEANAFAFGSGANVLPVYVKAEKPFDPFNEDHLEAIGAYPEDNLWDSANVENEGVIAKIKAAGFDGFYVKDRGSEQMNLAVFRPEQIKRATVNRGTFDAGSPDIRFSRSTLGNTPPTPPQNPNAWQKLKAKALELTSPDAIESLIYEHQDKLIDLKRLRDHIKALGGTITDLNDAYLGEELFHKRLAKRTQDFLSEELKPLLADMRARGVDMPTLERYLHARHAPEANRVLAERNPNAQMIEAGKAKARAEVKALEVQLQRARAQGTATKAIEQALEQAMAERDRWTGAQAFKGTEAERLSLSGMSDAEAAAFMGGLPAGQKVHLEALAARVDAMQAKTLEALEKYGLMDKATLDAWRSTYQFYVPLHRDEAHPDAVSHPIGQGFSTKGDASKRRTGSNEKVTNILAHIAMQREAALTRGEKNRVAKKLYLMAAQNPDPEIWSVDKPPMMKTVDRETGFVRTTVDPTYRNKPNVVMVRIGGKDHAITFNERNPKAVRMAQSIKDADVGDLNAFESIMGKATRWLASVNTQYNPIFGIFNFARDVQAAILQLSTTPLKGQERAVAAYVPAALKGIYAEVRSRRKGQPRGTGQWAKLWEEMQDEGGTTGYRELFITPDERVKALTKELNALERGKASEAAHAVVDWLSDYNETMENAVRLAAYKVALDQGMSKERAASLAKNLTVNFNRRGRQTARLGAYYAFLNAAIQGTARLVETLRGPLGRKIMLGGVMLGAVNALIGMAMMGGDDGEEDNWEKIPDFVKERSLIVPLGREDYLAIPMPLGYQVFPNLGRKAVEMMMHDDPTKGVGSHIADMLRITLDAFNPLGGSENLAQMVTPTPFDPAVALMMNRDWTGKPIYREDNSNLDPTPGHQRTKDTASAFSKAVSEALNKITGGTDYQPGAVSVTPDQIDYVIGQITGGLGREILKLENTITAPLTGDELPAYKIPMVGRLYGNTRGPANNAELFYEHVRELNQIENEIRGRARDGGDVAGYMAEEPLSALVGMGNAAENQIRKLRQYRAEVVRRAEPGYQDEVKRINEQMGEVMKLLNQEVRRAKKEAAEAP